MKLYLVRHGDSMNAPNDDLRALSEKGQKEIKKIANFLNSLKLSLSHIICSKKLRAQQTAKIILQSFPDIEITVNNNLDPSSSVDDIMGEIYAVNENTMLVGHMPFMGKLCSQLIIGNENQDVNMFTTGTVVCLEHLGQENWIIQWIINPEIAN